jgi:tetratricopeptide (TPR) repeat protein
MVGLVGLILYLLWYVIFLVKAYRLSRNDRWTGLILFSFLIGYFINNLFLFETINTAFILVMLFGFLFFDASHEDNKSIITNKLLNGTIVAGRYLLLVVFFILFYYLVYVPTSINRHLFTGYSALFTNKEKAYNDFEYASNHDFAVNEVSKQLHDSYHNLISVNASPENQIKFFKLAESKLWRSTVVYPWDIRNHLYLGQLIINSYDKPEDIQKAETLLLKAKEFSPRRPEIYYLLGQVYIKLGDEAKSVAVIEELASVLPNFADAKLTLANLYWYKDPEKASQIFEEAMMLPYGKNQDNQERIIAYLLNIKDYQRVLPYLLELVGQKPEEYKYRLDLSRVYYLNGDIDSAVEQMRVLQENAPDLLKDQSDYLKMLNINFGDN